MRQIIVKIDTDYDIISAYSVEKALKAYISNRTFEVEEITKSSKDKFLDWLRHIWKALTTHPHLESAFTV
jgi:hypothetical protein